MTIRDKMRRAADLRHFRSAMDDHLNDPQDHHANKYFHKLQNFCLKEYGESEVLQARKCVEERRKKEVSHA